MKKIIKKTFLIILLTPFVLLLAGTVYYLLFALLATGGESTAHQDYLEKNQEIIRLNTPANFTLFDSAFYQNQVFMLAEVHGFALPQELDLALLKHLNQHTGLRYYLAEVDYSQAYFLNQYLQTGDEAILRYVFNTWVETNAQWANLNLYNKFRKIYAFNQSLPQEKRIQVIGVDKIQDLAVSQRFLKELLTKQGYPAGQFAYQDSLQWLIETDTLSQSKAGILAHHLLQVMEKDTSYTNALGADIFHFAHILKNLAYNNPDTKRDSVMYLNLKDLVAENHWEQEKMYGLWGYSHTLPASFNNGKLPFAALLKADAAFKDKTVALNIFAIDSENMVPGKMMPQAINQGKAYLTTSWVNSNGPLAFVNGINDLKAVTQENSITLFKMDDKNSPYQHSSRLAKINVFIPGQSIIPDAEHATVAAAFPYVFLIRNSKALEPLEE